MNKYTFMGNGRNKDFYFTFPFFSTNDIVVELNGTPATGYGVFCIPRNNDQDFPFTGGRIHFAVAPKSTDVITIERKLQFNRLIDYQTTASLNPTTINQDMNYFFELLKDMKSSLLGFEETYAEFTDTESSQALLAKIDEVMEEIEDLGDMTTLYTNITNIGTSVSNLSESVNTLSTTVGTYTSSINALNTFKEGVLDYVIESQAPTSANGYKWYRKYKSGWVEQGGFITRPTSSTSTVTFPLEMQDTNYYVSLTSDWSDTTGEACAMNKTSATTKTMSISKDGSIGCWWQIKGMMAQQS